MSPSTPEHRSNAQRLDRSPLVRPGCVPAATQQAEGERLTPSRGLKKGVRYRYYVSRHLITGDKTEGRGMRLPAPGIEALIRTRMRRSWPIRKSWRPCCEL